MKGILLMTITLICFTSFSQTWEWANSYPGTDSDGVPIIKSDGQGNSYTLQMDSNTELDIVKRDLNGDTLWNNTFIYDSSPNSYQFKLTVDNSGNCYIASRYITSPGNLTYGSNTLTIPYSNGVVITKLDPQGDFVWKQDVYNAHNNSPIGAGFQAPEFMDLELTAAGDVLFSITGSQRGNGFFEVDWFSTNVQSLGDAMFMRLSKNNGQLIHINHVKALGPNSGASAISSVQMSDGGFCIVGSHFGLIDIDGTVFSSDAFDPDLFIAKIDELGNLQWLQEISTNAYGTLLLEQMSLGAFEEGGVALTGIFEGYIATNGQTYSSSGTSDCFAVKYSNQGDVEWARRFSSPSADYAAESRINGNDRLYFLMISSDSVQVDGNWFETGGPGESGGLLKLNELGEPMFFKKLNFDPWYSEIALKGINGAYIAGFNGSPNNPIQLDTISLNLNGTKFIGKIDESACGSDILPMPFNDSTICFGSSLILDPANTYDAYTWSTGETTPSISVSDSGAYYLTAYNTNGCAYTSEPILVNTAVNNIIPEICMVTVDDTSSHNIVVWDKPLTTTIDSFRIYRQAGSNYYHIGSRSYDSISQFIDTTVGINPNITSYRYKVSSVDLCGNESGLSDFHETMHLTVNQGTQGEVNLIWDTYEGFPFQYYYIYRDLDDQNNWGLVDSVSFLNFTYTDFPPAADSAVSYMVEIKTPGLCSAVKAQDYNSSRSNKPRYGTEGDDVGLDEYSWSVAVYPNPANSNVVVEPGYDGRYSMTITNTIGAVLFERHELMGKENINVSNFSEGVYIINIFSKVRRFQKKLVVTR